MHNERTRLIRTVADQVRTCGGARDWQRFQQLCERLEKTSVHVLRAIIDGGIVADVARRAGAIR